MPPDAPPRYRFTGPVTTGFFAYVDTDTGQMLVAEPGKDYAVKAVESGLPMPPDDRFQPVLDAAVKPAKAPKTSTEGGV